ncbi:MAG: hypothetical protein ABR548_04115 [Actinomycetota bacterium]|nr:hypothetical protein [Actinomycetota bacterium]
MIEQQLADHTRRQREPDPLGKQALFSATAPRTGPLGTLTLECSVCKRESPVRFRELPRLAMPVSFTLPRRYHTFMKCPGCGRRTWLRAHWRL